MELRIRGSIGGEFAGLHAGSAGRRGHPRRRRVRHPGRCGAEFPRPSESRWLAGSPLQSGSERASPRPRVAGRRSNPGRRPVHQPDRPRGRGRRDQRGGELPTVLRTPPEQRTGHLEPRIDRRDDHLAAGGDRPRNPRRELRAHRRWRELDEPRRRRTRGRRMGLVRGRESRRGHPARVGPGGGRVWRRLHVADRSVSRSPGLDPIPDESHQRCRHHGHVPGGCRRRRPLHLPVVEGRHGAVGRGQRPRRDHRDVARHQRVRGRRRCLSRGGRRRNQQPNQRRRAAPGAGPADHGAAREPETGRSGKA
jgi:hypothetical protein